MSFRLKTVLGIALIELVLLFILVAQTLTVLRASNESEIERRVRVMSSLLEASSREALMSYDLATLDAIIKAVMEEGGIQYIRYLSQAGKILASSNSGNGQAFEPDEALVSVDDGVFDREVVLVHLDQQLGRIQFGVDLRNLENLLEDSRRKTILIAAMEVILVAMFSIFLANYLTRNLASLRDASVKVSNGHLDFKIEAKGNDELAQTAEAFNLMIAALSKQVSATEHALQEAQVANEAKTVFLSNMSHELRTPLNSVIGFTRILLRKLHGTLSSREYDSLMTVHNNGVLLLNMVNTILDLSKISSGKMVVNAEEFLAGAAMEEAVSVVSSLYKDKKSFFKGGMS